MTKTETKQSPDSFSKEQILASDRFRDNRDIINAMWTDDKTRTIAQVESMVSDFMKGKVK